MHFCRSSSNVPCLPSFLEMPQNPHVLVTFDKVHNPLRLPRETTSEPPKVARTCGVLYILTSKCASRHNGVHFFDITTSKSGPTLVCSKCASRHNGVHFFISHLARWLRTRRFSEPPFRPSGATNHWKNSVSRLSYLFAHLLIVSLLPTSKVRTPRSKWKTDPVVTQCFPTLSKLRRSLGKGCLCNKAYQ